MNSIVSEMQQNDLLDAESAGRVEALLKEGTPLDEALSAGSGLPQEDLLRYLGDRFGVPYVTLETESPPRELLRQFPARALLKHQLVPLRQENGAVVIASSRLFDTTGLEELRLVTGKELRLVLASTEEIQRCTKRHLGVGADTVQSLVSEAAENGIQVLDTGGDEDVDLMEAAEDASIIRFVNQVLTEAIYLRATDVHFEPFEDELRVRYRVDGVLQEASITPEVRRFEAAII